jgi:eukaryotic-like serine/threonine-protein kinase
MSTGVCAGIEPLIAARLDDALPKESPELDAHLAGCAGCRALLAAEVEAPPPPAPVFPVIDPGTYELGPVLGHGGMGRIRIARDLRLGRVVAIKELLFHTDELAARFVREARIAASLQHPNIVPVYDVGCWADGTPFYVMRLVDGRTLSTALEAAVTLEARLQLIPAVIAVADAIAFAHAQGVVHRDLTPANVLLGAYGETIVIDWGLAKHLRAGAVRVAARFQTGLTQQVLTARGDVIGSPAYMPPEQARGEAIDGRADVYARAPPYTGPSARAILAGVREGAPRPVSRRVRRAPRVLAGIVAKAMARDVDERHGTAQELANELRAFQVSLLAGSRRPSLCAWPG